MTAPNPIPPLPRRSFYEAVNLVIRDVSFERNVTISVFEATIRVMGGLLSAHSLLEADELDIVFRDRKVRADSACGPGVSRCGRGEGQGDW